MDTDDAAAAQHPQQQEGLADTIKLNALLNLLAAVVDGSETAHNDAIVDQLFAMLLGKSGGPQTADEFGVLEAFGVELASTQQPIGAQACFERLLQLQQHHSHAAAADITTTTTTVPLNRLRTALNLENVRHQLVERWHFRMLNDHQRNGAYRSAITAAVAAHRGDAPMRILDIGTGTGLLAMYAHRAGAQQVFACDDSPLMAAIARATFARAERPAQRPVMIERHSSELTAADLRACDGVNDSGGANDADKRVDLIVTETLDAGAFGEGILQTLHHAHEHLLRPNGRVIPAGVQLYIAGFESRTVALEQVGMNGDFGELVYMRGVRLRATNASSSNGGNHTTDDGAGAANGDDTGIGHTDCEDDEADDDDDDDDEPYDSDNVHNIRDFQLITRVQPAFACDFQSAADIGTALSGEREQTVRLEYVRSGHLDGFVVWFTLQLDAERRVNTAPPDVVVSPDGGGVDAGDSCGCWEQAVFKLNTRFANAERLQFLHVTVSCAGGRLRVRHYYGGAKRTVLRVPADTVRFVNDAEYLTRLEYEFGRVYSPGSGAANGEGGSSGGNVLDLCAFPHIGFGLLKERRAQRLYCAAATAPLMRFVATANCLDPAETLRFVHGIDDVWRLPAAVRFDVILVAPVDGGLGVLDAEQVRAVERLRAERLMVGGRMVPHRVEMWGQLVRSEWLRRVTRVVVNTADGGGDELSEWGIAGAMNRFATRQQLGLGFFEHDCISAAFRVADVRWGQATEVEEERYVLVRLPTEVPETDLHGMLCFYKVWLMEESTEPISTRRFASHVRRMCYVLEEQQQPALATSLRQTSRAVVHVRQHGGLVECSLYRRGQGGSGKCAVVNGDSK